MLQRSLWALVVVCSVGCGGGEPIKADDDAPGGLIHVKVSVGAPLEGVDAVAYAIDPASGKPIEGRAGGAILAEAKGASAAGELDLRLADDASWDGPIQVVITGGGITYTDPSSDAVLTRVSLPGSFQLSSYVQRYRSGTEITVPVTLYTSLADAAVVAYADGKNPSSSTRRPLEQAMPLVDDLISKHLSRPATWDLRTTVPVALSGNVGGLRDVVYAALPDLALNQMARDISISIGQQPGSSVTAYSLLELLRRDISDGLFDGEQDGAPLTSGGSPAYALSADTTRLDMAKAIDTFVASGQNRTGLTRKGLQDFGVFDNIALDQSILYPQDETPSGFDNVPPEVSFALSFRAADGSSVTPTEVQGAVVTGTVTVVASAEDPSGVASVRVALEDGRFLTLSSETTNTRFVGSFNVSADPDGPLRFVATAVDMLGNTGSQVLQVRVDNTKPVLNVPAPVEGAHYSGTLPVNATAVDPHVTSFSAVGLPGFIDTVAAPETLRGQVDLASYEDGPIPVHLRACDAAKNCEERQLAVAVDNTMPTIELEEPLPDFAGEGPFVVQLRASDAGAGVGAVKWTVRGVQEGDISRDGDAWSLRLNLRDGANEVSIWAEDAAVPANSSQGAPPPHGVQKTIIQDISAPSLAEVLVASYRDETDAPLALSGGRPLVPGRLTLSDSKVRLDTKAGQIIRKTYVTSTWGGGAPPTGAELEGANPHNLPFRQFSVSYQEGDSPIDSVTWRIQASDDNWVTTHESAGDAIPANATLDNKLLYNVVFSRETIPLLNTATSRTVKFRTFVKARDLAGNEVETPAAEAWETTYELLDTPLHYVVDANYGRAGTVPPESIYGYRISAEGYANLFVTGANGNFPGDGVISNGAVVRVGRVRVYNPWPIRVAVQNAGSLSYSLEESWTNRLTSYPGATVTLDGHTFSRNVVFDVDGTLPDIPECRAVREDTAATPCGRPFSGRRIQHTKGASKVKWTCEAEYIGTAPTQWSASKSISQATTLYFAPNGRNADRLQSAGEIAVVPPSSGGALGELVVYPGVSRDFGRETWSVGHGSNNPGFPAGYYADMGAVYTGKTSGIGCSTGSIPGGDLKVYPAYRFELKQWETFLASSVSQTFGSGGLAFSARPVYAGDGDPVVVGPIPTPQTVPFSVYFEH